VYSYLFAHPPQEGGLPGEGGTFAPHASEIAFVYGGSATMSAEEQTLAAQMSKYWISFAKAGTPNSSPPSESTSSKNGTEAGTGAGAMQWPEYTADGDTVMRLDIASAGGVRPQKGLRKSACDWQDKEPQE
jgi:carboxylesterase type B